MRTATAFAAGSSTRTTARWFPRERPAARLLELYRNEGDDFIRRVDGSFNLAIYHRQQRRLKIFNDRLAFAHLHYYLADGLLLFAPELKAFLAHHDLDKSLDEGAIAYFFAGFDGLLGRRTYLQHAKILPPATKLEYSDGVLTLSPYWSCRFRPEANRSPQDTIDFCLELYRTSLRKRLPADDYEKIVVPLTGGLDSRLMLQLLAEQGRPPESLVLYTHGKQGNLDYRLASRVAAKLGLADQHRRVPTLPDWLGEHAYHSVWLTDGQFIFSNSYLIGVAEALGPGRFPYINGIMGAFLSLSASITAADLEPETDPDRLLERVLRALQLPGGYFHFPFFLRDSAARRFRELSREVAFEALAAHRHQGSFGDLRSSLIRLDLHRRSTIDLNKFYFYDVLPFVDPELLDLYLSIPAEQKRGKFLYQELYRRHFPDLAAIPWAKTGHNLYAGDSVIRRTQHRRLWSSRLRTQVTKLTRGRINLTTRDRYYDEEILLRTNRAVRQVVWPLLQQADAAGLDYFDQKRINHLLAEYNKGKYYYFPAIAKLFTFLAWHRLFVQEEYRLHDFGDGSEQQSTPMARPPDPATAGSKTDCPGY